MSTLIIYNTPLVGTGQISRLNARCLPIMV